MIKLISITLAALLTGLIPASVQADTALRDVLSGKAPITWAFPYDAFAKPAQAAVPARLFEGRLTLDMAALGGGFQTLLDRDGTAENPEAQVRDLPDFNFSYVSLNDEILPEKTGLIETSHPYFDWLLTPGQIWQEGAETHMLLPFALIEKNANCLHNGVLTFTLGPDGRTSHAVLQIASETCAYFQFNFWASYKATWHAEPVQNAALLRKSHRNLTKARLPVRDITELPAPLNPAVFAQPNLIPPAFMSAYGLVLDGVHYRGGCATRMGQFPVCDSLLLPSYSLAKSLAGGLGLMRLEALYPGAFTARVQDYVPECGGPEWQNVTFENLLDMTTGNYNSSTPHADEGAADYLPFFTSEKAADKTAFVCTHFKHRKKPGKKWVYHTSDTYLLGVAMNAYLSEKVGAESDVYNDQLTPLWDDLGLSPKLAIMRRTTSHNPQPFTGYGMVFYAGDIAHLAHSLASDVGPVVEAVAAPQISAALQQNTADRGLKAGGPDLKYNNGFWAWNARRDLNCKTDVWLPFLSGFGGITVVLLPGGGVYYYFSDNWVHAFSEPIRELSKIMPICGESS